MSAYLNHRNARMEVTVPEGTYRISTGDCIDELPACVQKNLMRSGNVMADIILDEDGRIGVLAGALS